VEEELTKDLQMEQKFTVTVSNPGDCKRVLSIEVPREEVEGEENKILNRYSKELKLPGFRKGKIPLKYIEKNYGDAIHSDAVQNLLPAAYEKALIQEGIEPLSQPKFENMMADRGGSISVDVTVEVRPEVKIEGYKDIKVEIKSQEIGDKEVSEALENLRNGFATLKVVERESKAGDYLIIDYAPLTETGEVDEQAKMSNYPVDLSSESLFVEFREGLVGMAAGEEKHIEVSYPEDFPDKEFAGKTRTFFISIREIKERTLPELNDDFAKQVGADFADLATLKKRIHEDLLEEEQRRFNREAEEKIIDKILSLNPFEVPDTMVENYLASLIEEDKRKNPNLSDDKEREAEIRKVFQSTAVRTIKKYFTLLAVTDQENIVVEEAEFKERIDKITETSGEKAEEIQSFFKQPKNRASLENQILDEKVLNFLRESADIKVA
jgi:trigger factor